MQFVVCTQGQGLYLPRDESHIDETYIHIYNSVPHRELCIPYIAFQHLKNIPIPPPFQPKTQEKEEDIIRFT